MQKSAVIFTKVFMFCYLFKRLLLIPPLMALLSLLTFGLLNLTPSDPAEVAIRLNDLTPTDELITLTRQQLGLDQPFFTRYWHWLGQILQGDFGTSFINKKSVLQEILRTLPNSVYLATVALCFILFLSVALALLCVIKPRSWLDNGIRVGLFLLGAMPNYWLALLLIWWLALKLDYFPVSGMHAPHAVILPAFTLALGYINTYTRLIRGAILAQWQQPYVQYAKARGLPQSAVLFRHIFRNALHSSLIALGMSVPKLLAGTVVIENIFAWNGIGRLCIEAILGRDYPMIQGYMLLMSLLFLIFNWLADWLQMWLDPRLRQSI